MKKFILIYYSPPEAMELMARATPADRKEGMKPWIAWQESLGKHLIDLGAPLANGRRFASDGSSEMVKQEITGYSIIQATDMNEAKSFIKNHPHLNWADGCNIEIYETLLA